MPRQEKVNVPLSSACRLLHPMHTVLVTCVRRTGKPNIITLAWAMPTSIDPPLVAISVAPERHSHALIEESKEFVINIPTMDIVEETLQCGRTSGRDQDKFKETGLTPIAARKLKPPVIKECVSHLECRLQDQLETGDHTIFVGEVILAYTNKNVPGAKMIFHLGGNRFSTLARKVVDLED
jgi:flavin reductase (DIM6/NTAB) family NADH-FMN oxidoreductase RutF